MYDAEYEVHQLKKRYNLLPPHKKFTLKGGHCTILGKRPSNEDAHVLEHFERDGHKFMLAAVFDGHAGDLAAKYCAEHFKDTLVAQECFKSQPQKAMKNAFIEMDASFCQKYQQSGCTATAMLFEEGAENCIVTANAGDARIIFRTNQLKQATLDHKPSSPAEKKRIEEAGSFVTVIFGVARVAGQLAVSRAIGDYDYKQFGVTAEPDTYTFADLDDMQYIVLACDGLYDVLTNEDIDYAVRTGLGQEIDPAELSEKQRLICEAMKSYIAGKVKEGDELLLQNGGCGFIN